MNSVVKQELVFWLKRFFSDSSLKFDVKFKGYILDIVLLNERLVFLLCNIDLSVKLSGLDEFGVRSRVYIVKKLCEDAGFRVVLVHNGVRDLRAVILVSLGVGKIGSYMIMKEPIWKREARL